MRVIAGSQRGRRLLAVSGPEVRPTADRVKEALFSIVESRFPIRGSVVLDLFAGTGSMGIEALSRGAERCVFVEQSRRALPVLEANLAACGFAERAVVQAVSVRRALRGLAEEEACFDGVFLDPPYRKGLAQTTLASLAGSPLLAPRGWVMAEVGVDDPLPESFASLRLTRTRRYGKTVLFLYSPGERNEGGCGGQGDA